MSRTARTVTVSLPPELAKKVDALARAGGRTRSELFRTAVLQYIDRLERWEQIFAYGRKRAKELGTSEKDVPRLLREHRDEQRA